MDLELRFDGLAEEVLDAVAEVQVDDLAMADAPAGPGRTTSGAFTVSPERPTVRLSVDLEDRPRGYEPGLLVTVRGRTADGRRVEFLNTAATRLPGPGGAPVAVALSRIS